MKKIICLLLLLLVSGCGKEEINFISISSFNVDMSKYEGMNSVNHHFAGATPEEFIRVFEENGTGVFYLGFDQCGSCQAMVKYMEEAATNTDTTIYYIDVYSETHPLKPVYEEIYDILYPVLLEGSNGEKSIMTPHFIVLRNGEIEESKVGGFDAEEQEIVKRYENMIKKIKP